MARRKFSLAALRAALLPAGPTGFRSADLRSRLCVATLISLSATSTFAATTGTESVAAQIRYEATLPNSSPVGRPLPLAASWNTGTRPNTFDPNYQLNMIEQGHFMLPWFQLDMPKGWTTIKDSRAYYQEALTRCAQLGLPVSFLSTQWERPLSEDSRYLSSMVR